MQSNLCSKYEKFKRQETDSLYLENARKSEFVNLAQSLHYIIGFLVLFIVTANFLSDNIREFWNISLGSLAFFAILFGYSYKFTFFKQKPEIPCFLFIFYYFWLFYITSVPPTLENNFHFSRFFPLIVLLAVFPWRTIHYFWLSTGFCIAYAQFFISGTNYDWDIERLRYFYICDLYINNFGVFFVLNSVRRRYFEKSFLLESDVSNKAKEIEDKSAKLSRLKTIEIIAKTIQSLTHDIKRPISAVRVFIAIIEKSKSPEEINNAVKKYKPHLSAITTQAEAMINDILEIRKSNYQSTDMKLEEIVPETLLENTVKQFQVQLKKSVQIITQIESSSKIMGNELKLIRVFQNILSNAEDALEDKKGKIWVRTFTSKDSDLETEIINIELSNNGKMIPHDMLHHLFFHFFQMERPMEPG